MKITYVSVAAAGLVLGLASLGCSAQTTEPSTHEQPAAGDVTPAAAKERIADTTQKLERAFTEQFLSGKIEPSALSGQIKDVVQAMPESAREKVTSHIAQVLESGQKLAAQLTPEERAQVAAPPKPEQIGTAEQAQIGAWGWPGGFGGWGGFGGFGFPGMFNWGLGTGLGTGLGWGGLGFGGLGGWGGGLGFGGLGGLGLGGWGGLGGLGLGGWFW